VDQGYRSGTSLGSKVGYGIGCVVGLVILGAGMLVLFLGDCPPAAACHNGEGRWFLALLLGAALTAVIVGLAIRRVIDRGKRTD
jgi:hypothetical protein